VDIGGDVVRAKAQDCLRIALQREALAAKGGPKAAAHHQVAGFARARADGLLRLGSTVDQYRRR
jgi:hypothetical protein